MYTVYTYIYIYIYNLYNIYILVNICYASHLLIRILVYNK